MDRCLMDGRLASGCSVTTEGHAVGEEEPGRTNRQCSPKKCIDVNNTYIAGETQELLNQNKIYPRR